MRELSLKYVNPAHPQFTHNPQVDFLALDLTGDTVRKAHFVSGRSGGKTACAVMLAVQVCIAEPGTVGLVLAPTYRSLQRSWLREFQSAVPAELYRYNKADECIIWVNGSRIYLSSRYVDNPSRGRDATRGLTVNWVIDDEAAWGFDRELYTNVMACIRGVGRYRFYACTTTPRLGNDYFDVAHSDGHVIIRSTSHDNPWNPKGWVDDVAAQMTEQQAKREINGEWVNLDGLIWADWSWDSWPNGNVYNWRFDAQRPWYLFLDLGSATAAYIVAQCATKISLGPGLPHDSVWIACAELLPDDDGSAARAFRRLKQLYGRPAAIVGGADMSTRSNTDGLSVAYFAIKAFGRGTPIRPVSGALALKDLQYDRLSWLIRDRQGARRFCIASDYHQIDRTKNTKGRGLKEMVQRDIWPDNAGKSRSVFLPKDGLLEHVRDALLYGAVSMMAPPRFEPER